MSTKCFPVPLDSKSPSLSTGLSLSFLYANPSYLSFPSKFLHHSLPLLPKSRYYTLASSLPHQNPAPLPTNHLSLAQDSISQFLHDELSVSAEESHSIASASPKYAQMIVDSVRDLEEWNSWRGSGEGGFDGLNGELGFKEKVIFMVREKGDGGKVAFLESVGLSLSSAMALARYLSSESLLSLIDK